ncbi:sensor histidine kinase [Candidimonas nitroreducens]|uniref:histidine kinase n=1 Tax=Candidimonas nitroreducens TaxID=683354 RepID=A0A225M955_9BURK|nr:sensor histidine kinase [Candidimonas nitroreducens]OWT57646.1 histidine kinase [Candidimonas nitroreducens]
MNSLRVRLALWVLLPLAVALSLSIWFAYLDSLHNAQARQDHRLWTSALIIAGQIQWTGRHTLAAPVPPVALEVFASSHHDQVFFSVSTAAGQLLAGWPDLPVDFKPARGHMEAYQDMLYQGRELRAYSMARDFFDTGKSTRVIITVAQTQEQLAAETHALWWPSALRETGMLVLVLVLMLLGLRHELKPLAALHGAVWNRDQTDLRPIRLKDLPLELRPVVETINQYGARLQRQIDSRRRFIEDAAHQLRTPMALLSTQLHYAAGLASTPELKKILMALGRSRLQITQLVNQLLSLSQAENLRGSPVPATPVELDPLVQEVMVELAPLAAGRDIELGVGPQHVQARLQAHRPALRALLFNLLDNAIRYTPRGGAVTVSVALAREGITILEVEDTGPGIPPELRTRVFERFNRGNAIDQEGTGLGLAIVQEAARACGGSVSLHGGRRHRGLLARVVFKPA